MPNRVLIDMFHLQIEAPSILEKAATAKIRRTLRSKRFTANLRQTIRTFVRRYPTLRSVRVTLFS